MSEPKWFRVYTRAMTFARRIAVLLSSLLTPSVFAATWISLGVFSTLERAIVFAEANGAMVVFEQAGGVDRFRVALGPYPSQAAAKTDLAQHRRAHPDAWLIDRDSVRTIAPGSGTLDTVAGQPALTPPPAQPLGWLEATDVPKDAKVRAKEVSGGAVPSRATSTPSTTDKFTSRRDHEDDRAPRGYGMHELRRSEDRRE